MKALVFDRKLETLVFISNTLQKAGVTVHPAENGSMFLVDLLNDTFDAFVVCKNELEHYNVESDYFYKNFNSNSIVYTYRRDGNYIKNIEVMVPPSKKMREKDVKFKKLVFSCRDPDCITPEFIYSLPKKSAILLNHLLLNEKTGITNSEISRLFWGEAEKDKTSTIYSHIYNLRKSLKQKYRDAYIIHKDKDLYRLVNIKRLQYLKEGV